MIEKPQRHTAIEALPLQQSRERERERERERLRDWEERESSEDQALLMNVIAVEGSIAANKYF